MARPASGHGEPRTLTRPSSGSAKGLAARRDASVRREHHIADLRFGSYLAPGLMPTYRAIADAVGRSLGCGIEFVVETSYESCLEDRNDVCFVCSLPYVMFERQGISPATPIAAPVLTGTRYQGAPVYFSDVIVHRDSPFRSFLDLRGRSWSYNEPLSQSGYGITRYHLVTLGETDGFFGEVIEAGFHQESIRMVANGEVDGSAIDSQVLSVALRDNPQQAASVRVVAELGPSTIPPIAVSNRLGADVQARILDALLTMHEDPEAQPLLEFGLIERFTPVGPDAFDDIRSMVDACEAAGFMELR